jgi:hypothetical protein
MHQNGEFNRQELVEVEKPLGIYKEGTLPEIDGRVGNVTTNPITENVLIDQTHELNRISASSGRDSQRRPLKLFLGYAHENSKLRDVFMENLALLEGDGLIELWFDGRILPSAEWDKRIRCELEEADIIVFLVSTPFLASKYIRGVEMERALERRKTGEAEIVSVILEDCAWQGRPFTQYQLVQPRGKAVCRWSRKRDAFNAVEFELRKLISQMLVERAVFSAA